MDPIKEQLVKLQEIVQEHPIKIPLRVAAEFLGMNEEALKAALMRGNAPFGFAYQLKDGGYRVPIIPTTLFYLWFTNTRGREVMMPEFVFKQTMIGK